ncbi:MAG: PadR family transcriptional regulator [Gemmatimonadaceae bacterium]
MPADPKSFLPLKPADLLLLLSLVEGEQHGYALVRELAERSDGALQLEPGNLYRVIKRLVDDRLVDSSTRRPVAELDDERRRYYRITALGEHVAAHEVRRLRALLSSRAARALPALIAAEAR